jgi:hypothetical protein
MSVWRRNGKKVNGKFRVLYVKIAREILTPGLTNTPRIKPLSFTEADLVKRPVPGRHGSLFREVSRRFTP